MQKHPANIVAVKEVPHYDKKKYNAPSSTMYYSITLVWPSELLGFVSGMLVEHLEV